MELKGGNLVGGDMLMSGPKEQYGVNPVTGERMEPGFHTALEDDLEAAVKCSLDAFQELKSVSHEHRAEFLEECATQILELGDDLIDRTAAESGLPLGRLRGERKRTVGQLQMFAEVIREGSWLGLCIDHAEPEREPIPKPDVRLMQVPLGPVVVFGASNFPLAYSVAGGDTASALAAGCPVICKAHPNHPGASELVGRAIQAAAQKTGMPAGVFSLVHGGLDTGRFLVQHPGVAAVGFTGSLVGGRAIFDLAAARPDPIPVYAEMGSVNPVFVLPGALRENSDSIAAGLAGSVTVGVGQFCTNPGLVFVAGENARQFSDTLATLMGDAEGGVMLHAGIRSSFEDGKSSVASVAGVEHFGRDPGDGGAGLCEAIPSLYRTDLKTFLQNDVLSHEVFGPATLVVLCDSVDDMVEAAGSLPGQLTGTIHATDEEVAANRLLVSALGDRVGRIVVNGYPTGVEVCASMQHGGPYPATTDARSTSVGRGAVGRFTRPVSYQNFPDSLLPSELLDTFEGIPRMVDGAWEERGSS